MTPATPTFTRVVWIPAVDCPADALSFHVGGRELADWYGRKLLGVLGGRRLDHNRVVVTARLSEPVPAWSAA